uniref:NADH-ubiquinone oxidoreductase chain 2 n=1 Tax=Caenis robusta TaxID=446426 RepID=A0A7D6WG20_9INSE|nr:NADH dehydrogenase subunit 2 [Caenis robusta]UJG45449.1 NADH dehydrogenase subunit 2 [Caenis robusta]
MNPSFLMFATTLISGTLITVSSTSWLGIWMGLEMNLISFIPMMSQSNKFSSEAALKYFLTQAFASSLLLMCIIVMQLKTNSTPTTIYTIEYIVMFSLLMKMGAAPTHFWFPEVSNGLNWLSNMILMTWQKIAPFIVLMYLNMPSTLMLLAVLSSALIGAMGGFSQTSLRKILAYSSINHMSWMLISVSASQMLWMTYFIIYSTLTLTMMYFFMINNMNFISQLFQMSFNSPIMSLLISFNMMSMGGLPPFMGFYPKWLVMEFMMNNCMYLTAMFMIMMTLIVLYFYMRIMYSSLMMYSNTSKLLVFNSPQGTNMLIIMTILGLVALPMMIMI